MQVYLSIFRSECLYEHEKTVKSSGQTRSAYPGKLLYVNRQIGIIIFFDSYSSLVLLYSLSLSLSACLSLCLSICRWQAPRSPNHMHGLEEKAL